MLHFISLSIPVAVFLPNLFFFMMPPVHRREQSNESGGLLLSAAEGLGRLGVLALPIFSPIHLSRPYELLSFMVMLAFLAFYYAGWIRYFIRGRQYRLLFSPMIHIPIPMAIAPVLYFIGASVVLHSYGLLISSVILAIGHIPSSLNLYRQLNN